MQQQRCRHVAILRTPWQLAPLCLPPHLPPRALPVLLLLLVLLRHLMMAAARLLACRTRTPAQAQQAHFIHHAQ